MTGADFIALAGKLAANANSDEAAFRSAVSRAYYGAYHIAISLLEELGFPLPANANGHLFAQRTLVGSGHQAGRQAGYLLGDLHADRIKADYKLENRGVGTERFAKLRVEAAVAIQSALSSCRSEPGRGELRIAVAAYLHKARH
jgi:hypothetical protein